MSRLARSYILGVLAAAIALTWSLAHAHTPGRWAPVVALVVVSLVTENNAFELPLAGSVSLSFAVTFAALLYAGPLAAAICAVSGAITFQEVREGKPAWILAFNVGQLALSAGAAGLTYVALGGKPLADGLGAVAAPFPAASGAAVFYMLNVVLVGSMVSINSRRPFRDVMRMQGFASYAGSLVLLALLGYVVAHLIASSSWFGLLLLVLPFAMARQTFRVYAELNEAYTETVRSLVTAIEAKDRYTRGHSERVAVHARRLAAALGLTPAEVDLAERAALLHDVGKIGLSQSTLTSAEQLSAVEVRQVRRHPVIGAELAEDVAFLSDVVPVIRHHHERVDGAGYPDGLVGPAIPLLARILAVVDSYDAMTSDRAYRPGMSDEAARAELKRVAGRQLDERLVAAFNALSDEPLPGEAVS